MRERGRVILLGVFLVLLAGGCSGSSSGLPAPEAGDFELKVVSAGTVGDCGSAGLTQRRTGSVTTVEVAVDGAVGLKAFCFELGFDAEHRTPVSAEATGLLRPDASTDDGEDPLLELADLKGCGTVAHGQVLARFEERPGFTGSGTVAVLRFTDGPAAGPGSARETAAALVAPELSLSQDSARLSWVYHLAGDYNVNRFVEVADMVVVGQCYGLEVPCESKPNAALADGNRDGMVTVADISTIGQHYGNCISYYEVFYTEDPAQRPENGPVELPALFTVQIVPRSFREAEPNVIDVGHSVPAPNGWFWVCANYNGERGPMSNSILAGQGDVTENVLPVAVFIAETTEGEGSLTVGFDATASSDSDGTITRYEWDWDAADQHWDWEDGGASPLAGHTYEAIGRYTATLRVTDDDGAMSATQVELDAGRGLTEFPVAELTADPEEVHLGHRIQFDATASYDPDGEIVSYQWDLDRDGEFEIAGPYWSRVRQTFKEPGVYTVTLRVEDDMTARAETSLEVTVLENLAPVACLTATPSSGEAPLTVTFDPAGTCDPEDELTRVNWEIDGLESYVYRRDGDPVDPLLETRQQTYYLSGEYQCTYEAKDEHNRWSEEAVATINVDGWETESWVLEDFPAIGDFLDMMVIDGRLALVVSGFPEYTRGLWFCLATDATAVEWLDPVLVDTGLGNLGGRCDLELVNGLPAVTYFSQNDDRVYYRSALDLEGREWNDPVVIDTGFGPFGGDSALAVINGNPAVAWGTGSSARYRRALDADGLEWSDPVVLESGEILGMPVAMREINGRAAVCWAERFTDLRFTRLADDTGSSPVTIYDIAGPGWGTSLDLEMYEVNGLPAIMYVGHVLLPENEQCSEWYVPVPTGRELEGEQPGCQLVEFRNRLVAVNQQRGLEICGSTDLTGSEWLSPQMADPKGYYYYRVLGCAVINDRLYSIYNTCEYIDHVETLRTVCSVIY